MLVWILNFSISLVFCILALSYGVVLGAPTFDMLLLAWVAGLIFTWTVIEPSEVLGMVLLPMASESDRVQRCRNKLKELGIYG